MRAERLHERLYGERDPRGEAARAAHIARQCHHARGNGGARGETAGHAERAVGAGVVDDDQVVGLARLPVDAGEAFGEQLFAVVRDHDSGDGITHGSSIPGARARVLSATLTTMLMHGCAPLTRH